MSVEYTTPPCPMCDQTSTFKLDDTALQAWKDGMLAQRAFPTMTDANRETLISGMHPKCWNELMGPEE